MKKEHVFKILVFFLIAITVLINISNAMDVSSLTGDTSQAHVGGLKSIGGTIIKMVSTVGSILSIIVLVVLGIKYMIGSVEEKAEYKKTFLPFVIGAALIFAASNIANVIYDVAIKLK